MKELILLTPSQYAAWKETRRAVHTALVALSSVCDGAQQKDKQGFNGVDSTFGKGLARKKEEWLTLGQVQAAYKLLVKYKKQIKRLTGIEWESVPKPTAWNAALIIKASYQFSDRTVANPNGAELLGRWRWWGPHSERLPIPDPSLMFHTLDIR